MAAVVIALGTATALAAPASADSQSDQTFLKGLQQKGVAVKSDQWAIDLAHSTVYVYCRDKFPASTGG
ncbi:MAG TPA: hypothetical protein VMS92_04015 [Mycobacterium sp.]|nr:hypothetical protein [Mycobacterium sp.]